MPSPSTTPTHAARRLHSALELAAQSVASIDTRAYSVAAAGLADPDYAERAACEVSMWIAGYLAAPAAPNTATVRDLRTAWDALTHALVLVQSERAAA